VIFEWREAKKHWAMHVYISPIGKLLRGYIKATYILYKDGPPYRWGEWVHAAPRNYHHLHTTTIDEAKVCLEVIARMR
jgi:hypothetical protein